MHFHYILAMVCGSTAAMPVAYATVNDQGVISAREATEFQLSPSQLLRREPTFSQLSTFSSGDSGNTGASDMMAQLTAALKGLFSKDTTAGGFALAMTTPASGPILETGSTSKSSQSKPPVPAPSDSKAPAPDTKPNSDKPKLPVPTVSDPKGPTPDTKPDSAKPKTPTKDPAGKSIIESGGGLADSGISAPKRKRQILNAATPTLAGTGVLLDNIGKGLGMLLPGPLGTGLAGLLNGVGNDVARGPKPRLQPGFVH